MNEECEVSKLSGAVANIRDTANKLEEVLRGPRVSDEAEQQNKASVDLRNRVGELTKDLLTAGSHLQDLLAYTKALAVQID